MSDNNEKTLSELCYEVYEARGQYGVYDYVRANHPEVRWHYCTPCEDKTPTDPSDFSCLVCGSHVVPNNGDPYTGEPKPNYPGTIELTTGVFLDASTDPAIYFADHKGEIVCWNYDEIKEDPSAWVASLNALFNAARKGVSSLRKAACKHVPDLSDVRPYYETDRVILDSRCKLCGNPCSWDATPSGDKLNWEHD